MIRLVSDPFGFGWNLLGTARYRPDIGIVGARSVWYTAVVAIVFTVTSFSLALIGGERSGSVVREPAAATTPAAPQPAAPAPAAPVTK